MYDKYVMIDREEEGRGKVELKVTDKTREHQQNYGEETLNI